MVKEVEVEVIPEENQLPRINVRSPRRTRRNLRFELRKVESHREGSILSRKEVMPIIILPSY